MPAHQVSRAEKKLFLNAMVAETDPDEMVEEREGDEDDSAGAALGIGGSTMSKVCVRVWVHG